MADINEATDQKQFLAEPQQSQEGGTLNDENGYMSKSSNLGVSGKKTTSSMWAEQIKKTGTASSNRFDEFRNENEETGPMQKYTFNWVNKKDGEKLYQVIIELPHLITVLEAIRDVIPYFNQKLSEEGCPFTLSPDAMLYDLYKSRKTGHPKLDYPALDSQQILNQTGIQQISLVEKEPRAIIMKGSPKKKSDDRISSNNSGSNHMVQTTMPQNNFNYSQPKPQPVESETVCFCFEKKKKNPPSRNISLQNSMADLNEPMLSK